VIPPPRNRVTLVSPGNLFLEKVLRTDPTVALEVKTPSSTRRHGRCRRRGARLVHAAKVGPGRYVFVNTVPPDVPLEVLGRIERRRSWTGIARTPSCATSSSRRWPSRTRCACGRWPPPRARGGGRRTVLYALEEPDRKAIFIGFDLFKTDFRCACLPLDLSNTLRWLHPAALDQSSLQLAAGQPILLPVAHGISSATVTRRAGAR